MPGSRHESPEPVALPHRDQHRLSDEFPGFVVGLRRRLNHSLDATGGEFLPGIELIEHASHGPRTGAVRRVRELRQSQWQQAVRIERSGEKTAGLFGPPGTPTRDVIDADEPALYFGASAHCPAARMASTAAVRSSSIIGSLKPRQAMLRHRVQKLVDRSLLVR